MRLPRPAPFVCRACARTLRAPARPNASVSRSPLAARHYANVVRPFRVAVVGSGPAGFYATYRLMAKIEHAVVDMYEQQPVPYGLTRFGVAPDHPEVKNCQDKFEEVAASDRFNFIGNVNVGHDISLAQLTPHYDALLFAYGASKDKELGIPGENLQGVYSAREFVGWYNGLPEYAGLNPQLKGKRAVIIGQGNVALDVARILLSDVDALRKTDIAEHALEVLAKNKVRNVKLVGRRGPMQAAFTIKEVRELFNLPNVAFRPLDPSLFPPPDYKLDRQRGRLSKILSQGAPDRWPPKSKDSKRWSLDFNLSPTSFSARFQRHHVSDVTFQRTVFTPDSDHFDRRARVQPAPRLDTATFWADVAFRSVGYRAAALPGLADVGVPFDDERGLIPNDGFGRVVARPPPGAVGLPVVRPVPGAYVAGWVSRGPTGVIATTMEDAFVTADAIARDWLEGMPFLPGDGKGWGKVRELLDRRVRPVSWEDWKRIDVVERERGKAKGKEREKFVRKKDMLEVLDP
ncbi:NADPh-adrenodoxin reductase [Neofusicoccum parvum]|uniref:NADPh-adrenodoxin reductase n=1 Tax=Neofusicoccum parvum TaxID=310453 RepID=A0ACB5RTF5_9PEZI|nr:NADPh-adrenodoxin reductase [Neofusicoccum parvum]